MSNNSVGQMPSHKTCPAMDMAAYDLLPPALRKFLRGAVVSIAAESVLDRWRELAQDIGVKRAERRTLRDLGVVEIGEIFLFAERWMKAGFPGDYPAAAALSTVLRPNELMR